MREPFTFYDLTVYLSHAYKYFAISFLSSFINPPGIIELMLVVFKVCVCFAVGYFLSFLWYFAPAGTNSEVLVLSEVIE